MHRHLEMSRSGTLTDRIRDRARHQPDAEVLVGSDIRRTWVELEARTNRAARVLRRLGLHRGDRAAILAANCPEWMEAFCGVHKAGGVVVPLNERLTPAERGRLLDDAGATVLVGDPELVAAAGFSGPTLALGSGYETQLAAASDDEFAADIQPEDLAVIAYTSGTTGLPKGVMWSHRALLASAQGNPFPAAVAGGARVLLCAPLCAGGAIVMACNALAIGATLVIAHFTPEGVLQTLVDAGIEFTGLVPTMIALLVDAAPPGWRAPALRRIFYGAGTMSPQLFARAQRLFGCEFQQAYGMTETCALGTRLDPVDHTLEARERLASAGKPMPGVTLKIVDESGAEVPPGTAGEILIRSPGNMVGYWNRPEETRDAVRDGWYRTGDMASRDQAGYLYLVDRKHDMIKSGGFSISPAEVERVLCQHPAVAEAAVFGVPDDRWGEAVRAVVRLKDGYSPSEDELIDHCRKRMASYKKPVSTLCVSAPLPRNALGKVLRRAVREKYWPNP